jgi:hypothetical protein
MRRAKGLPAKNRNAERVSAGLSPVMASWSFQSKPHVAAGLGVSGGRNERRPSESTVMCHASIVFASKAAALFSARVTLLSILDGADPANFKLTYWPGSAEPEPRRTPALRPRPLLATIIPCSREKIPRSDESISLFRCIGNHS